MQLPKIFLQAGRDEALRRYHPWVFSGAVSRYEGHLIDGDVVEVYDKKGNYLATGHYHDGSIAVRVFSFEQIVPDVQYWTGKLTKIRQFREAIIAPVPGRPTDCYRLVHGEGDGCSGLIIDYYNGVAVFQAHSIGMHRERHLIAEALQNVYGKELLAVYDKSHETVPDLYGQTVTNGYLIGSVETPHEVHENGQSFWVDWVTGQKTGFFLDQRDNRQLLARYAQGKRVLNAFCYSGGFSVYALGAGATLVHSVDVSQKAIDLTNRNIALNVGKQSDLYGPAERHEAISEDVMTYLKAHSGEYDIVVLDPPAYAKNISARHRAVQGYKRLNIEGFKRVAKGGILFTFSCSQVVDRELFYNTVVAAAIEAGRQVRVLHHLSQPADHPVSLFHPEGGYLKGLVLWVE
ncbi:MAG: class I SAM-dependent rRNA methyltransferase [Cytophagales bacterium]|nr:MAG: class I SAM-dependent rRNA methyltransferase [Cytophagales bacterium]